MILCSKLLSSLWNLKIQILPVLLAVMLFELPAWLRKLKKLYYTPIYFSVFPFSELNLDLGIYLNEEYMANSGFDLEGNRLESLRRKLILTSAISLLFAAVLTPIAVGVIGSLFLTPSTLLQFLVVLTLYKTFLIAKSLANFHYHALSSPQNKFLLAIIYFFYIGIIVWLTNKAYYWTVPYTKAGDWLGLLGAIGDKIFGSVGLGIVVTVTLSSVFSVYITDRRFRQSSPYAPLSQEDEDFKRLEDLDVPDD